jgi:hypothetical protein
MPDVWEKAHALDPNNAGDGATIAANGYTNVENYLNELAGDPILGFGDLHATTDPKNKGEGERCNGTQVPRREQ